MTKKDIARKISATTGYKKSVIDDVLNAFFSVVTDGLKDGNKITFADFGVFEVKQLKERMVKDPMTNELYRVPAHKKVYFRSGKKLKEGIEKND